MSADKVFSVPELADMILSLYRDDSESPSGPDNFVALQTVNKQWRNLIWASGRSPADTRRASAWSLAPSATEILHSARYNARSPLLSEPEKVGGSDIVLAVKYTSHFMPQDMVRVRDDILSPSPASWIRLQDTHFQRITTLDLDFFTIRPLNIVSTIAESCPQLHLPRLTTLRASTDITQEQLTVVQRFMQPTVTTFDFIVWGHKEDVRFPRRYQYPLNEFERLAMEDRSSGRSGAESFPDFPEVCSEIPSKMPLIAHLRFVINDVEAFLWTGKSLPAMMIHNLERLETLELSTYGTEPFFLEAISTHCTLRTITTSQQSWPLRCLRVDRKDAFLDVAEDAIYGEEAFEPELEFPPIVPSLLEEHAFEYLTTLQLTTSVFQLSEALQRWPAHVLSNLQRFDIDTSLFNVRLGDDPRELMQLIAARFPVLKAFSIGLLYSTTGHRDRKNRFGEWLIEQIQVDADLLRPLTAVTRLTSLEVRANRSSCISVHDWPALLKFWPHLEVLVLDNTPRTYSVKVEGKQCRAQRCTETRGDILVPAYVVPVRDSKA
ncbi:hypothetical protein PHLGIDRAFT_15582 [Phlebiopsis gigantea 11061_1 CR5-6]|uniref:Uncharacterized protein n=1 Tax=Phlebiopsis gigantea (strain 11061_1 CR5-6) TaxID=745531 RepID=A0A0C3S2L1_PHLG1|nr:hypothetical protein PHLGIDRAFT_15582 [Phlebiopsis gigantea 11061_1 CR5-6]